MIMIQLIFQIVLLVMPPYGKVLEPICKQYKLLFTFTYKSFKLIFSIILGSGVERTLRYIGLVELSKLQLAEIFYFYLPELIMVCTSTIVQHILIKINVEEEETSHTFMEITDTESKKTWQQTSFISIAISIGKIKTYILLFQVTLVCTYSIFILIFRKVSLFGYYLLGWSSSTFNNQCILLHNIPWDNDMVVMLSSYKLWICLLISFCMLDCLYKCVYSFCLSNGVDSIIYTSRITNCKVKQ